MYTLGINAVFHDSAACIMKNGILIAAAEEERFTHIKHGKRPIPSSTYELPYHAINYCLERAGLHLKDVDHVAYSFDPSLLIVESKINSPAIGIPFKELDFIDQNGDFISWDNLFLSAVVNAPKMLVDGFPHHLQNRFEGCTTNDWEWHFVEHHLSHAASAYLPSPFQNAAVMTLDGRGEIATTTYNLGEKNNITRISEVKMPHSLGLLYERLTTYLGFLHSSDEYKVMALASYGKPEFVKDFDEIIQLHDNGQYRIRNENFEERFGKPRMKDEPFTSHHFNIAHSLQHVLEERVLELTNWFYKETKKENLCLAGGVALNCVLNARIRDRGPFKSIWVQPAAGDSGTALGAAMWVDAQLRNNSEKQFIMTHAYWGPEYSDEEIEKFLSWAKVPYTKMNNVAEETAEILAQDKIIGWFQGRMEYGPRALGSRSILASPIHPEMQSRLNEVKDREDFRPVAPVVLAEDASEWFSGAVDSPFMLFIYDVTKDKEDKIPAVKHIDGTARIQTISEDQHPEYYKLLKAFKQKTGIPVLVNTSFNTLGKPIVCSPRDAIECFWASPFDALIMGSYLIVKKNENKDISSYSHLQKTEIIN